jgi:signal peptidase II
MSARWPRPLFYLALLAAIALDQGTKAWAAESLRPIGSVRVIPGFFDLTYNQNTGVAFGMFAGQGLLVAIFMIVLALVALYYMRDLNWAGWEPNLVGGCLCGGAFGNLLDRFRLGYVIDFFDVYVGPHHWPIFNVADSLICLSVAWIVVRQFMGAPRKAVT